MKILGIDPGSTLIGFGVLESERGQLATLAYGVITIKSKTLPEKLREVSSQLSALLATHKPDQAGIEKLFFAKNRKTAIEVAQARGVIVSQILAAGVPLIELTPAEVKVAVTSYGAADKFMVKKMVGKILNIETLEADDNAWDGLAIAIATASLTEKKGLL